ncbi:ABC-2 type transport system ATP-binding protein [Paenibacillus shirakamiensis]|uniref:ABC-2 type transport system ATP-binding protein n=1 Tax=Paenibacillus shirakamiensis TaxID=1265935 RepID=A0ABS4JKM6_9BACL|nr:ABC transporter ATP-binding protein [Paenibacillus shirakamiensis]MBP2002265.1 ABC-2 type transport system ATP-binding protein [Paenibacillus shirakamiensis]
MTEINVAGVSKSFHGLPVLTNIHLEIEKGTTVGIVGANGSGKSVLFKIICGFIAPDQGSIYVRNKQLGKDIDFPEHMGVLIDSPAYISIYSGFKNLKFLADIKRNIGTDEIREAMRIVGLDPDLKTRVADYSLGMKQKLGIAQAIMEGQDILILDEPFNALDYQTYNDIKEIMLRLKAENKTMLLTSHNYEDLDSLCDVLYIIQGGHLEQLTEELKRKYFRRESSSTSLY